MQQGAGVLVGAGRVAALQGAPWGVGEQAPRQPCVWVAARQWLFGLLLFLGAHQPPLTVGVNAQSELEQAGELPALLQACVIRRHWKPDT